MRKYILITVSIFGAICYSIAQEESFHKYFIGLNGGYSNLSGNYIKSDYTDSSSGFANSNGINFELEGGFFMKKNFGLTAILSTSSFYSHGLVELSDGFREDFEVDSITLTASGRYSNYNLLVGPVFSISKGKFSFTAKAVGGISYLVTPEYKVDIEDQLEATFYQRSGNAIAFGFQTGLAVRYSITNHFGVKLGLDYFYSKPNITILNENRDVNVGRKITEYHQKMTILNTNLEIGRAHV